MAPQVARSYMSVPPRSKSTERRKLRGIRKESYDVEETVERAPPLFFSVALFGRRGALRQRRHKNLIHPAAIHIHDLESQAVPLEAIRGLWHSPQRHHH